MVLRRFRWAAVVRGAGLSPRSGPAPGPAPARLRARFRARSYGVDAAFTLLEHNAALPVAAGWQRLLLRDGSACCCGMAALVAVGRQNAGCENGLSSLWHHSYQTIRHDAAFMSFQRHG